MRPPVVSTVCCAGAVSLAQLAEHVLRKRTVMGSSPIGGCCHSCSNGGNCHFPKLRCLAALYASWSAAALAPSTGLERVTVTERIKSGATSNSLRFFVLGDEAGEATTTLDNGPSWTLPQGLSETTSKELISISFSQLDNDVQDFSSAFSLMKSTSIRLGVFLNFH